MESEKHAIKVISEIQYAISSHKAVIFSLQFSNQCALSSHKQGKPNMAWCLTTVGEFEGQHTALMQVELILVRLGVVEHLHIAALHAHSQPLTRWAVAQ